MLPSLPRRVVHVAVCALPLLAAACGAERAPGLSEVLRVGVLAPPGAEEALLGARLGAEEAARAGELVGRRFELLAARPATPEAAEREGRRMVREGAFALVGGFDDPTCRALAGVAEREGVLFLNVGCRADALRGPGRAFHVQASDAMYEAALARHGVGAVLWHPSLSRYGAAQLNERFRRRHGRAPGESGWAGWMAVKLLWEAALRARTTEAAALAAFLESDSAAFDGHKGEPLAFDRAGHQLRQPLYPADRAARAAARESADPGVAVAAVGVPPGEGPYALVSNEESATVTVVHAATGRVLSTIPVGGRPRGIQVGRGGRRAYVALSDDVPDARGRGDAIAVIDLARGRVVERHPAGTDPEQFAVSPDGRRLYVSNEDAGTASITDLSTGWVLATLVVGIEPEGVAASPDGRWVYVTAETSNTVSVIDTRTREVVASFLVDVRPRAAAFSPDGRRAYVTNEISGTVSVVDAARHEVVGTVALERGAKPVGVVVSPDGKRVYVADGHGHSVSVIDAGTLRLAARVPVGRRPWGIALSPDGARIYTANGVSNDLSVIDAGTLKVVGTVPVGERPWGVAVAP